MSITDELRKYTESQIKWLDITKVHYRNLLSIADRIDAEHESACAEAYGNGVMSVPIALDESAYVELPKDANGEVIHVRDVMDGYGKTIEVVELRIGRSGWVIVSRDGNAYADTSAFAHHKPPTVEDVLEEMYDTLEDARIPNGSEKRTYEEIIAEYAAKLQLRGEGE